MSFEQEQVTPPVEGADTPELAPEQEAPVEAGTTEQAAETDEQRNERAIKEREERARRRNDSIQRRFNELTADKRELAEQNRRLMELLQGKGAQPSQPTQPQPSGPPKPEDYSDYQAFQDARTAWVAEQKAMEKVGALVQMMRAAQERQQQEQVVRSVAEKMEASLKKIRAEAPDYDDVIQNLDIEAPPAMAKAIFDSDDPARIFHALAKNPSEARRIAAMPPLAQIRAIGRIEAALSTTPQVSNAPRPGKPVGTSAGSTEKSPRDMTPDEYYASITRSHRKGR